MSIHLPVPGLVTAPSPIVVTELTPGTTVTLQASAMDRHGEVWRSRAHFLVAPDGQVDTARDAPVSGHYAGVDPRGLIWTLRPRDDLSPAFFETPDAGYDVTVQVINDETVITQGVMTRLARHPGVQGIDVRDGGLYGTLFTPPDTAPLRGAVLQLGGSEGGLYPAVGALLASEGFLVLSLAYFGLPGLPASLVNIPLDYFHRAITLLRQQPRVAGRQVGVTGASKGAEAALLLGATYPEDIGAVAAIASGGVVFEGIDREGTHPAGTPMSSWSLDGRPLPYVPYHADWNALFSGPRPVRMTPIHEAALHQVDEATLAAATIPVERCAGPVLLVTGGDDQVWNAAELSDIAVKRRHAAGLPGEHLSDPHAGHALSLPGFPTLIRTPWTAMGGTDAANARLQHVAWARTLDVLSSVWNR